MALVQAAGTPRSSPRRRGAVLVLFVLLLFVLASFAALTIDMGLARLTQAQMQGAADSAALEGLRGRDDPLADPDLARRQSAARFVAWTFDDDLGATAGDALRFGAGPEFALSGGTGSANASQFLDLQASSVYDPELELNDGNELSGDLVAGDPLHTTAPVTALEDDQYVRADFDNQDRNGNAALDAFLVRLRRTNDRQGLDEVPGVSSRGPTLPLLFGLAAFLAPDGSGPAPSTEGLTLRATAIAAAGDVVDDTGTIVRSVGQVLSCGPEDPAPTPPGVPRLGAVAFTLSRGFFADTLIVDAPAALTFDASGTIFSGVEPVGRFARLTSVGQIVASGPIPAQVGGAVYLPVFDAIGVNEVCVGFGYATVEAFGAASITLTKRAPILAPQNASAHLPQGLVGFDSAALAQIEAARAAFRPWSLRAPVLFR